MKQIVFLRRFLTEDRV